MTINDVGRIGPQDNELEAIKKRNADLQFSLDKEVNRVMDLKQQNAELLTIIKWANNHGGLGYSIHAEFEKAIAKAGG